MTARLIRMSAFLRRELLEIWRQPRLLLTLVVGPFVILGVFGAGLRDQDPDLTYVLTGPAEGAMRDLADRAVAVMPRQMNFGGYTSDRDAALDQLRQGRIDIVVSLPEDPQRTIAAGGRAAIVVHHDLVDPIESRAVELTSQHVGDRVNRMLSRQLVERGQAGVGEAQEQLSEVRAAIDDLRDAGDEETEQARQDVLREVQALSGTAGRTPAVLTPGDPGEPSLAEALTALEDAARRPDDTPPARQAAQLNQAVDDLDAALQRLEALPPENIVSPFLGIARRVGPGGVGLTEFYAPAVVVVLVQHMLVSFLALSLVREKELGTDDLFRIAPLTAGELLVGKSLAYLLLGLFSTVVLVGLLVVGLDVPLRGSVVGLALAALATYAAAVALGFTLALVSQSHSQAVQTAMLVLLASIFFSGFVLSLARFHPPLDVVARALPATYGVSMFRDVMLRGRAPAVDSLVSLAVYAAALTTVNWWRLRRRFAPA
ncbi:MAG TPA: ABC transporter permease [Egibacteraceae bacterium]|nr:ABC transporter permease [Egibacteraceae bacterium]